MIYSIMASSLLNQNQTWNVFCLCAKCKNLVLNYKTAYPS